MFLPFGIIISVQITSAQLRIHLDSDEGILLFIVFQTLSPYVVPNLWPRSCKLDVVL